jgi:hypothetical protein
MIIIISLTVYALKLVRFHTLQEEAHQIDILFFHECICGFEMCPSVFVKVLESLLETLGTSWAAIG